MSQVALRINGRTYEVTCEDGQEEHLREVGAYFDSRVRELASAVGQVGEGRLLVIAGLLVADELFDVRRKLEQAPAAVAGESESGRDEAEGASRALDEAASRIDTLARKLAQA